MFKRLDSTHWFLIVAITALGSMSLLSSHCYAQPIEGQPVLAPDREPRNIARLNLGIGLYDSGWYACNYYYYPNGCSYGSYTSYVPLIVGVQMDIHLSERSFLTPGFQAMSGSVNTEYYNNAQEVNVSNHVTLWEPTLDYVGKFGPLTRETLGRFRVGGALYFGSDGEFGGALRLGGGVSFFNHRRVGIGLDAVFEAGSYNGNWISGLQLLFSPELHF